MLRATLLVLFSALLLAGFSVSARQQKQLRGHRRAASPATTDDSSSSVAAVNDGRALSPATAVCEDTDGSFEVKNKGDKDCDWAGKKKSNCGKKLADGGRVYEKACPVACAEWYPLDESCGIDQPTSVQQQSVVKDTVSVMTWNLACRDFYPYSGCENCDTRFGHIADAIDGKNAGYENLPDFDQLDIIVGQELFTESGTYQQITDALKRKGFHHVTSPMPDSSSPQCGTPLQLGADLTGKKVGDNGGLVMWSRYPVKSFRSRLWCAHAFPTYQGYTTALVEVEGRSVVVFNTHFMPEIPELLSEDIRMYQFSEIANLAKDIDAKLSGTDAAYSIIVGGDYNEDAYGMNHKSAEPDCSKITNDDTIAKLGALNFDLVDGCEKGLIGASTWDPTVNDLAARFSSSGKHEILDYLVEYGSSSGAPVETPQVVHNLRYAPGWTGEFCNDAFQGTVSGTSAGTANSLSDHNAVVAKFSLPPADDAATTTSDDATAAFEAAFDGYAVQTASCGQAGSACVVDSNCCRSPEYSFDGTGYQCSMGTCTRAKLEGESCDWLADECALYNEYNTGNGLHCETSGFPSLSGTCVKKFDKGHDCLFDHECDSGRCNVTYWWGIPTGKECK